VFENRVLRKIFGSKWDEVLGGWRKLHNKKLDWSDRVKEDEMGRACSMHGRRDVHIGFW
jgi:hypothetical protein